MHTSGAKGASHRWLFAGAGFLLAFGILTELVRWHDVDGSDRLARSLIFHSGGPGLFRSAMEAVSFWGGEAGQIIMVAVACTILWHRRRHWALSLPVIMAGAGVLQLTMKWVINRPRPNLDPWGFPSAHVLSLVVLLGCLAYVINTFGTRRGWRWLSAGGCSAIVCTVAYSRMYLDAHWLSDVLGGFSIGLAYLFIAIWVQASLASRTRRGPLGVDGFTPQLALNTAEPAISTPVAADRSGVSLPANPD